MENAINLWSVVWDQAKCMIEQDKSDNLWSFRALECHFGAESMPLREEF